MTDEIPADEPDEEPDIEINLDAPDTLAYEELIDGFGDEMIEADLQEVVKERVRDLYDNQDMIRQRIAQAQKQQR